MFFILTILFSSFFSLSIYADQIAITIDDPGIQQMKNLSSVEINQMLIKTLSKHKLEAMFFVCGERVDDPFGKKMLHALVKAGHSLGNHSYSHMNFNTNEVTLPKYSADLKKNTIFLAQFKNVSSFFRFPMLKEGETLEKRDGFRDELRKKKLKIGHVTIDNSDWYISDRLAKKIKAGVKDYSRFKDFYLGHILDRLKYYDSLAKQIGIKEVKHTLLIHHNVLNAYFLDDLISKLKEEGHTFISPETAFLDPIYSHSTHALPAGESLIWALARESGKFDKELRYPGEDGEYLRSEMDKLGL